MAVAVLGWGGHPSVGAEQGYCASLNFLGFYSSLVVVVIMSKFISIIKLFLSQSMVMGMTFFSVFFTTPLWESADQGQ